MLSRFEWDPYKAAANFSKHGVSFPTAARIFADPRILIKHDRVLDGEQRWHAVGKLDDVPLLVVIHTVQEDNEVEVIRIISARTAERWERQEYEEGNG